MGLVYCPECNEKISQFADTCPKCSFPLKIFMKEHGFTDISKACVCPKCGNINDMDFLPFKFKCDYCETFLIQTKYTMQESFKIMHNLKEHEQKEFEMQLANTYGCNQFDENLYNNRIKQIHKDAESYRKELCENVKQIKSQNTTTCPKCGSTQFTPVQKKFSLLTGFATNKVELVCNNCGTKIKPR